MYEARSALNNVRAGDYQQFDKAEYYIHKALVESPDTPLAAVIHLRLMESKGSMPKLAVRNLAQIYHERWPDCLQFQLTLANELNESGESNQAVEMLHQAVSKDVTGQVAKRMWGEHHPYSSMWPLSLMAINSSQNSPQNIPIPAAVASHLGWNQIAASTSGLDVPISAGNTSRERKIRISSRRGVTIQTCLHTSVHHRSRSRSTSEQIEPEGTKRARADGR